MIIMRIKRITIYLLLIALFVCCVYFLWYRSTEAPIFSDNRQTITPSELIKNEEHSISDKLVPVDGTVGSGMDSNSLSKVIQKSVKDAKVISINGEVNMGVTSHHLPTASPLIGEFFRTLEENAGNRKVFVVLSPDHYEKCQGVISVTSRSYSTPFGELKNNTAISDALVRAGAVVDNTCFTDEHGITVLANYIKYLYPDAEIVPIVISMKANDQEEKFLVDFLNGYKDNIFILGSIDFNHYNSLAEANASDVKAAAVISSMESKNITREMVDSPGSMRVVMDVAKQWGRKPSILRKANSYEFVGLPENTTSYMNVIFIGK